MAERPNKRPRSTAYREHAPIDGFAASDGDSNPTYVPPNPSYSSICSKYTTTSLSFVTLSPACYLTLYEHVTLHFLACCLLHSSFKIASAQCMNQTRVFAPPSKDRWRACHHRHHHHHSFSLTLALYLFYNTNSCLPHLLEISKLLLHHARAAYPSLSQHSDI